jgi:hypothetical protein
MAGVTSKMTTQVQALKASSLFRHGKFMPLQKRDGTLKKYKYIPVKSSGVSLPKWLVPAKKRATYTELKDRAHILNARGKLLSQLLDPKATEKEIMQAALKLDAFMTKQGVAFTPENTTDELQGDGKEALAMLGEAACQRLEKLLCDWHRTPGLGSPPGFLTEMWRGMRKAVDAMRALMLQKEGFDKARILCRGSQPRVGAESARAQAGS